MIKKYTEEDLDIISAIELECFPEGVAYSKETLKFHFDKAQDQVFIVVSDSHTPIGYFWWEFWPEKKDGQSYPEYYLNGKLTGNIPGEKVLYIANVSVIPEYRGRGIGKQMVEYMLTNAGKWSKAILAVDEKHVEAINIYRKLGFEFVETMDWMNIMVRAQKQKQ